MRNNVITTLSVFVISNLYSTQLCYSFFAQTITYMHMRFRLSKIIQQTSNYNYQFTFRPRLIVLVALYQTIKRQMRLKAIQKSRLCNQNKYTKYGMFTKIYCMFCTCRIHKQKISIVHCSRSLRSISIKSTPKCRQLSMVYILQKFYNF